MSQLPQPIRNRLPDIRSGSTIKGQSCGIEFYVTVNFYDDTAQPGEVFVVMSKTGSDLSGFADALALTMSVALQYGVPWETLRNKYMHTRFGHNSTREDPSIVHAIACRVDEAIERRMKALALSRGPILFEAQPKATGEGEE